MVQDATKGAQGKTEIPQTVTPDCPVLTMDYLVVGGPVVEVEV
jgi:hypothetical protein